MPPIESLPPDQRAVLELVLRRGRSYDEIAQLLSIDRAGVRQRALSALDALGPEADVPPERRALITDYLLSSLPPRVADQVRGRLAQAPAERAWARVIAAELEPISSRPLPEIPSEFADTAASARPAAPEPPIAAPEPPPPPRTAKPFRTAVPPPPEEDERPRRGGPRDGGRRGLLGPRPPIEPGRERSSSRRGGRMVLIAAAIIVLAIILSIVLGGGGKKSHGSASTHTSSTASTASTSATGTGSTAATGATGTGEKIVAQVNLKPPSGGSSPAGIAEILKSGTSRAVAILAQHLTPNQAHNAYAVWLYNSPGDALLLGFVNPPVTSTGKLQAESPLPSTASHFHHLLVTVETKPKPTSPGQIILEGTLAGVT